jgi:hypothetical protein
MISNLAVKPLLKFFDLEYLKSLIPFSLSSEMMMGIIILAFLLLWGVAMGKTRTLISLVAFYMAFVFKTIFPFYGELRNMFAKSAFPDYYFQLGVFFLAYIIILIVLNGSVLRRRLSLGDSSFISILLINLMQFCLVASILVTIVPADVLARFPVGMLPYFFGAKALFAWFSAPLVLLFFLGK